MARQDLTVQRLKSIETAQDDGAGSTITFTAAVADGFAFYNDGFTSIRIKTSGTGATVTVPHPGKASGLAVEDLSVTLGATDEQELPLLPPGFNQDDTFKAWLNFSSIVGVTVAAVSTRPWN